MGLGRTQKAFILFVILRLQKNWVADQKLRLKPFVNESITGIKSLKLMSFPEKSFQNEVPKENNWKITKNQRKTLKKNLRNKEAVWHYLINSSKFEFITL